MQRRDFLAGAAVAATVAPVVRAQQRAVPVIGFLGSTSANEYRGPLAAFHEALGARGYVEGRTLAIEYRWAQGRYEQLPALAADLVRRPVAAIATAGGLISARAAAAATLSIPIVFVVGADPVRLGLVASLNRPGGNVTGVSLVSNALVAKRMELLHELVPKAAIVVLLVNPGNPSQEADTADARAAAQQLGFQLNIARAKTPEEIERALDEAAKAGVGALLVEADGFFISQRAHLVELTARLQLPAIYEFREFVAAGGLVSYGASRNDAAKQVGSYIGRILDGEKAGDLPVQQPTIFELTINLQAAAALGLTVPPAILARADEVIE